MNAKVKEDIYKGLLSKVYVSGLTESKKTDLKVYDMNSKMIGIVEDMLMQPGDLEEGEKYINIKKDEAEGKHVIIPAGILRKADGDELTLTEMTKEDVEELPEFEGSEITNELIEKTQTAIYLIFDRNTAWDRFQGRSVYDDERVYGRRRRDHGDISIEPHQRI